MTKDILIGVPFKEAEYNAIKSIAEEEDRPMGRVVRRVFLDAFRGGMLKEVKKALKSDKQIRTVI
ncbi:hypothetical protein CCP3SC15_380024 [Gammaproteobacteria bacterium]